MESKRTGLAIVLALLAAIIGGVVWLIIAILTDRELGIIAWGIGGLAGYAVILAAKSKIKVEHQVIAVIASLLGIVLGRYFIVGYFYDGISGIFDSFVFSLFFENFFEFFDYIDIIFILLAVGTAWQLPKQLAEKEQAPQVTETEESNQVDVNQ